MGFNSVYRSLVEMFPQIDARALKAVAIEHNKDADAAAEYIITEVLPRLCQQSVISNSHQNPFSDSLKYHDLRVPTDVDEAEHKEENTLRIRHTLAGRKFRNNGSWVKRRSIPIIRPHARDSHLTPQNKALDACGSHSYDANANDTQFSGSTESEERKFRNNGSLVKRRYFPSIRVHARDSHLTPQNKALDACGSHSYDANANDTQFSGSTESEERKFRNNGSLVKRRYFPSIRVHARDSHLTPQNKALDACGSHSYDANANDNQFSGSTESEELILLGKPLEKNGDVVSNAPINDNGVSTDLNKVSRSTESEESVSDGEDQEINVEVGSDHTSTVLSTTLIHESGSNFDKSVCEESSHASIVSSTTSILESGSNFDKPVCEESHQVVFPSGEVESFAVEPIPPSMEGLVSDELECVLHPEIVLGVPNTECEKQYECGSSDLKSEQVNSINEKGEIVDASVDNTVTRSGQIYRIDLLEEMIEDAKSNKKTLFLAMESTISLMREVELQEKAAEQVKDDAAKGGMDIMIKVEELKEMLVHAKEANDMHAGEVYGEKAILATEARELQTRLLNLSEERDASLTILNEMRQSLEARLSAAEEVRKAAEQEKVMKEEAARKYLYEQEAIMEKVVQESKILQKEAEENSKLQEFLMDRGRLVDSLQGEISVICQDVRLLKQKFDDRVPLSQSISSSQTTCRLASSGSSLKSMASLVAEQGLTSETLEKVSSASTDIPTPESRLENELTRRELLDDGWDLFEHELGCREDLCQN